MNNEENDYMFDDDFEIDEDNNANAQSINQVELMNNNVQEIPAIDTFPTIETPVNSIWEPVKEETITTNQDVEPTLNYDFDFSKNISSEPTQSVSEGVNVNNNVINTNDVFGVNFINEPNESSEVNSDTTSNVQTTQALPESNINNEIPEEIDYASMGAVLGNEEKPESLKSSNDQIDLVPNEFQIDDEPKINESISNEFQIEEDPVINESSDNEFKIGNVIEQSNDMIEQSNEPIMSQDVHIETAEPFIGKEEQLNNGEAEVENLTETNHEQDKSQELEEPIIKKPSLKLGKLPKIKLNTDQKFILGLVAFIALSIFLLPYIRAFFNK